MRKLKQVTGVVLLAGVMSISANLTLAGAIESPGKTTKVASSGSVESPGFFDTILIMATLIM
jgi:hypothetical protein